MKYIYRLNESKKGSSINEQIVTDHDSNWDYKKEGDVYFTKKKTSDKWLKTSGKVSDSIRTKVFKDAGDKPSTTPKKESFSNDKVPFKNKTEGNEFREWMNKWYPKTSKKLDLDTSGSFNNSYITKAWNQTIKGSDGNQTTLGKIYTKKHLKGKSSPTKKNTVSDTTISKTIDDSLIKTDTLKVNSISSTKKINQILDYGKEDCAQFVNDFTKSVNVVGDAWLSHDTDGAGSRIHSIYTNIDDSDIKKYIDLFKKSSEGKLSMGEVRSFNKELLSKGPSVPSLKLDDIVGIYYDSSDNHLKAFKAAGQKYFVNGDPTKPGKTLESGRGFSFNTHVGIVGAIKDGTPIVFHNVHGNVISEPANSLDIAWVKRS